jgi:hypothetical protein
VSVRAETPCAFAAVNGNCTLTLDRLHPVAPPVIYVRRGKQVTVRVTSALPFEHLTLERKAAAEQLPADQFRNGFADITAALGALIFTGPPGGGGGGGGRAPIEVVPDQQNNGVLCAPSGPTVAELLKSRQCVLANDMKIRTQVRKTADPPDPNLNFGTWVYSRLCSIRNLFMPLAAGELTPDAPVTVCRDLPRDITPLSVPKNVGEMVEWKNSFAAGDGVIKDMRDFLEGTDTGKPPKHVPDSGWEDRLADLDADLAVAKKGGAITAGDYVTLKAGQQLLHGADDSAGAYVAKIQALTDAVGDLVPRDAAIPMPIPELLLGSQDDEVQTWDLNAGNLLAGVAGLVKADKFGNQITRLMGGLADPAVKQTVVEIKIEYFNEPRMEISSGLLVPVRPYHSYTEATLYSTATGTSGTCTAGTTTSANCPIVQQTSTVAVVPNASFNILLGHELVLNKQREAFMWTIAAGYNTATTSAALGTGLSYSYRSMVFSFVPIVDQEQHLTGGFQVGQSAGTAAMPTTTSSWRVNPSIGISLRIPLGGGSQ